MKRALFLLLPALLLLLPNSAFPGDDAADDTAEEAKEDGAEKKEEEKEPKTIEELTKDSDLIDGLFPIYRDRKTGDVRLLISSDQLDKPYLYFSYIENGASDAGWLTRGSYRLDSAKVFRLRRFFDRIEFIEENTNYYLDPAKAIARAADANISHAVLYDEKIESEDEEKRLVVINANKLFLTEALHQLTPLPDPEKKPHELFSIGKLSEGKSKIRDIRSYPKNTDVIVEYVYENDKPYVRGSPAVTDPRFISIIAQHTLIEAPEEPMAPRFDDPRVGYFMHEVTDLSSVDVTPYRDVIRRWRLEKKDPQAELSEPVKPIVFWIENTTPKELRPIIEAASLRWNEAFEQAGFKNAIQVETQPDDATWDAGDLRYNVIRWVASPSPRYSGYGPSFSDPRTGEQLGADIMLEHSSISRTVREIDVMGGSAASLSSESHDSTRCAASMHAQSETQFAMAALEALGADSEQKQRLLEEFIYFLTLHEIGHTLGLSHNFRSSYLHSMEDVFNPEKTYPEGLYASVMDYPAIPFKMPGEAHPQYWTTRPGAYDRWAIEYGYSTALEDAGAERERLDAILSRSTRPELAFGNDADDMRAPGKAIDPRAMVGDLTSDPISFAAHQIALVKAIQPSLLDRLLVEGESAQQLLGGYWLSLRRYRGAVTTLSRFIGGVHVDRAMTGQEGATQPLTPVSEAEQRRAMKTLREELFAPSAFDSFDRAANHLLPQRRGWNHGGGTEDPKLHQNALDIQKSILEHLLHPLVLARITDTSLYGNEYRADEFLIDLTNAVFEDDMHGNVNTFRQNVQLEYVARLLTVVKGDKHDRIAQSLALNRLRWIQQQLSAPSEADLPTQAHRDHLLYRIEAGLDPKA